MNINFINNLSPLHWILISNFLKFLELAHVLHPFTQKGIVRLWRLWAVAKHKRRRKFFGKLFKLILWKKYRRYLKAYQYKLFKSLMANCEKSKQAYGQLPQKAVLFGNLNKWWTDVMGPFKVIQFKNKFKDKNQENSNFKLSKPQIPFQKRHSHTSPVQMPINKSFYSSKNIYSSKR